jgi:heme A synthase
MADPVWPTYPWHLLLIEWVEPRPGFLVEHSHRLAGNVVGCCSLILALGFWHYEPRTWLRNLARVLVVGMLVALFLGFYLKTTPVWLACGGTVLVTILILSLIALCVPDRALRLRWLGTVAVGGVILQGMLGGFRVRLDAPWGQELALFHGFFAQIIFALLVSLAVFTSRSWQLVDTKYALNPVRRLATLLAGLVLLQVLLGGFVRHTFSSFSQRLHLLGAFLVVGGVIYLLRESRDEPPPLRKAAHVLAILVALQVALGVEAWMTRLAYMSTEGQAIIRTAHFLIGASVFATAVVTALLANRGRVWKPLVNLPVEHRELEAVV